MPTTTETRTRAPLAATLALAAALALLGGCDGGIFGTGDGSPGPVLPDAAPQATVGPEDSGAPSPETSDADDVDVDTPVGTASEPLAPDSGAPDVSDGGTAAATALGNALVADPSASAPQLRVVNAGSADVALASDADAPGRFAVPSVAAGTASPYVALPPSARSLTLGYPSGASDGAALEGARRFEPLLLQPSSVTTLLVRDGQRPVPTVDALPTLIRSDDPDIALVRLVPGSGLGPEDGPLPTASYTLVPDGANPGGGEVELGRAALGGPADAGYASVPAGDYRLESSAPGASAPMLSFAGGSVRTLVPLESGELLVVADGG